MRTRFICLKFCLALSLVLFSIVCVIGIINFLLLSKMTKIEKNLLCEATRIPHTLFFGNPETRFSVKNSSYFLGFETLKQYISSFLKESDSFISGKNSELIKSLEKLTIGESVGNLSKITDDFFASFEGRKSINASGEQETPSTISYSLPLYKAYFLLMLEQYKDAANRLENLISLSPTLANEQSGSEFVENLSNVNNDLLDIKIELSAFWNKMMLTSFDGPLLFKVAVIFMAVEILILILIISLALFTVTPSILKDQPIHKKKIRCLLMIMILGIIIATLNLVEIGRGVYSSFYGCSLMFQLKSDPVETKQKLSVLFVNEHIAFKIFDKCYFKANTDKNANFYSLFKEESGEALQQFVGFMDGIKMLHEDVQLINRNYDKNFTNHMIEALESYEKGINFDFNDVKPNLDKLNNIFNCSDIMFSLSESGCKNLPSSKKKCINIQTQKFEKDSCITESAESELIFSRLQKYIKEDKELISQMLYYLDGEKNNSSIIALIEAVLIDFESIDNQVKSLDSELEIHFENMNQGELENWLDCGVIKEEIAKNFNSLCGSKLEDITNFAALNLSVLVLMYIIVIFLIFCLLKYLFL